MLLGAESRTQAAMHTIPLWLYRSHRLQQPRARAEFLVAPAAGEVGQQRSDRGGYGCSMAVAAKTRAKKMLRVLGAGCEEPGAWVVMAGKRARTRRVRPCMSCTSARSGSSRYYSRWMVRLQQALAAVARVVGGNGGAARQRRPPATREMARRRRIQPYRRWLLFLLFLFSL